MSHKMIGEKTKNMILEYLRNETSLKGTDIMKFEKEMKKKGVFEDIKYGFTPSGMEKLHKESIEKSKHYSFGDD